MCILYLLNCTHVIINKSYTKTWHILQRGNRGYSLHDNCVFYFQKSRLFAKENERRYGSMVQSLFSFIVYFIFCVSFLCCRHIRVFVCLCFVLPPSVGKLDIVQFLFFGLVFEFSSYKRNPPAFNIHRIGSKLNIM